MVDPKALKKLADACRKAGIKHYKDKDLEFTMSDDGPYVPSPTCDVSKSGVADDGGFESDSLTDDQLLMWSATGFDTGELT